MGGDGRGAKSLATLFGRFQKHINSLPFSSNKLKKHSKKTHSFYIFFNENLTKKWSVMVKIIKEKRQGNDYIW